MSGYTATATGARAGERSYAVLMPENARLRKDLSESRTAKEILYSRNGFYKDIRPGRDHFGRIFDHIVLACAQKCKYQTTTYSRHGLQIAPKLLDQLFTDSLPGHVWGQIESTLQPVSDASSWQRVELRIKAIVDRAIGPECRKNRLSKS